MQRKPGSPWASIPMNNVTCLHQIISLGIIKTLMHYAVCIYAAQEHDMLSFNGGSDNSVSAMIKKALNKCRELKPVYCVKINGLNVKGKIYEACFQILFGLMRRNVGYISGKCYETR